MGEGWLMAVLVKQSTDIKVRGLRTFGADACFAFRGMTCCRLTRFILLQSHSLNSFHYVVRIVLQVEIHVPGFDFVAPGGAGV